LRQIIQIASLGNELLVVLVNYEEPTGSNNNSNNNKKWTNQKLFKINEQAHKFHHALLILTRTVCVFTEASFTDDAAATTLWDKLIEKKSNEQQKQFGSANDSFHINYLAVSCRIRFCGRRFVCFSLFVFS